MTEKDFLARVEGTDEFGKAKAVCALSLIDVTDDENQKLLKDVETMDGVVSFAIVPGGLSMIDLVFSGYMEYEFIQMSQACNEAVDVIRQKNKTGEVVPMLTLTIMEKDEYGHLMHATCVTPTYLATGSDGRCNGLRFIVRTDQMVFLKLDEEQLEHVKNQLETEV